MTDKLIILLCTNFTSVIRPGTQAAEGMSKADLDKRTKVN